MIARLQLGEQAKLRDIAGFNGALAAGDGFLRNTALQPGRDECRNMRVDRFGLLLVDAGGHHVHGREHIIEPHDPMPSE